MSSSATDGIEEFISYGLKTCPQEDCRICLDNVGVQPIFGNATKPDISMEVITFGGIQVNKDDDFPQFICQSCFNLLENAMSFRTTAKRTDALLKRRRKRLTQAGQPKTDESVIEVDLENPKVSTISTSPNLTKVQVINTYEKGVASTYEVLPNLMSVHDQKPGKPKIDFVSVQVADIMHDNMSYCKSESYMSEASHSSNLQHHQFHNENSDDHDNDHDVMMLIVTNDSTKSTDYTKTMDYSRNTDYTKTIDYTKPPDYLKNVDYTKPTDYLKTPDYTKPTDYLKNPDYTKPTEYLKNPDYTKPTDYLKNIDYTKTIEYTKQTVDYTKQNVDYTINTTIDYSKQNADYTKSTDDHSYNADDGKSTKNENTKVSDTKPVPEKFYCKFCKQNFSTSEEYEEHRNTIQHKRNYVISFLPKKKTSTDKEGTSGKTKLKDQQCNICNEFFTKIQYPRHMLNEHDVKVPPVNTKRECKICQKMIDRRSMPRHVKRKHENDGKDSLEPKVKLECPICKKVFAKQYFPLHMNRHKEIENKKYVCDQCGRKFAFKSSFNTHRLVHTNEYPHKCDFCPYQGRTKGLLKIHMRTHTGDYPFKCTQCDTRCLTKSNLNWHMRRHRGPIDFVCGACNRGFYSKLQLERHISVTHYGQKNHICSFCGSAFGYRNGLMRHLRKVHKRPKVRGVGKAKTFIMPPQEQDMQHKPPEPQMPPPPSQPTYMVQNFVY